MVTQPYDKITPAMQERYLQTSPYNLIDFEKGNPQPNDSPVGNVYTRAEQALETCGLPPAFWCATPLPASTSIPRNTPSLEAPSAATRKGFIALGRVEDYAAGIVFSAMSKRSPAPKSTCLELLNHTRTHTGQLFMLYTDPARRVDTLLDLDSTVQGGTPAETLDEYGVIHRLWPIFATCQTISSVVREMAAQKLVIADGHHRYETALAYCDQCRAQNATKSGKADRDAPYEKAMMTFFNTRSEGLLILPTHRVVANLPVFDVQAFRRKMAPFFDQENYSFGSEAARTVAYDRFRRDLAFKGADRRVIGMYAGGEFTLFQLRPQADLAAELPEVSPAQRQLDVVLLHRLLLEKGLGITSAAQSPPNTTSLMSGICP